MRKAVLVCFLLLTGCATTYIQSVRHPDAPPQPYNTVLVYIDENYREKVKYEDFLIKKLKNVSETRFVAHHDIFNPLQQYTAKEVLKILTTNDIEAVLFGQKGSLDSSSSTIIVPTLQTSTTRASGNVGTQHVNLSGISTSTAMLAVPTTTYSLKYTATLFDVKKNKTVWLSSSTTVGDGGFEESLSNAVIKEMRKSDLIVMKPKVKQKM